MSERFLRRWIFEARWTNEWRSMFDFYTDSDPTHGSVNFVDQETAQQQQLGYVQDDGTIVLAVDDKTVLPLNKPRNS